MFPGAHLGTRADHPAYVMASTAETVTYGQLDAAANRLANFLRSVGVQRDDHVALCLENHPRYIEILWGCHYAGTRYTACSSRLTVDELTYILVDCGAKVFITSHLLAARAAEVAARIPGLAVRLMVDGIVDGFDSFEQAIAPQPGTPTERWMSGADMLYSSGTTGRPKGVRYAFQREVLERRMPAVSAVDTLFGVTDRTVTLSPAPLYHAAPLRWSMSVIARGGTVVVMEHFDAEEYLRLVERYQVTHSQVVPTMLVRMLKLPPEVRARYAASSMQYLIHAAAPCPVPIKRQIIDWFGPVVYEYYAGTEGNGFVFCDTEQWLAHPGTVGFPIGSTVHIVGDDGRELPPGQPGTIFFEGGSSFEYHNDPAKTKDSQHPSGWTTLGDVGYLDGDGFVHLTDRKAYMIISGGVNIYPQEAENLLITHPRVTDVAVFGVPNEDFGEEVKAVVQPDEMPADDAAASALARELIAFCRSHLADLKCPRTVDFRPELPRHPTGKLYKRLLKDEYWEAASGRA